LTKSRKNKDDPIRKPKKASKRDTIKKMEKQANDSTL
jgi:hypothetical protein